MLVAAAALLTGCGSGPNQVGSAAIVGSTEVSLGDTQKKIDAALGKPGLLDQLRLQGDKPADISREVVSRAVQHVLLAEAARRENIQVSDDQVDAELTREGGIDALVEATIYDRGSVREAVRDQLVSQALARKLLTRVAVTVDVTNATSRADAVAKARKMASGPAGAAAVLAADPRAQRNLQLRAALVPQSAASFLFGTPAGSVVAAQTSPAPDGWTVLRVTARTTKAPGGGDPKASSVSQLDDSTLDDIGRRFTQPLAQELGVRVNPRYGVWDPLRLAVLAPGTPAGLVLPAALS
ncbi:MAG TPA: SurA N-terminal domain-containing protein [Pseudonocardia sp.]|nr:SurA N-terminal domain-containing protein [Pseudonocardia sp.]